MYARWQGLTKTEFILFINTFLILISADLTQGNDKEDVENTRTNPNEHFSTMNDTQKKY